VRAHACAGLPIVVKDLTAVKGVRFTEVCWFAKLGLAVTISTVWVRVKLSKLRIMPGVSFMLTGWIPASTPEL
jgi:hypothetical protein